ncbi:MFS transporter [Bacillus sp. 165]|nr:MFS transporter [Bacillus sp. 165]
MGIFQNRNFRKLFFAMFTSQLGTTVGNMAFAFYLLDRFSNQPSYATLAELMYALPTLFVFFIVGVLADRMDRKRIAENSDWIRAGLTVLLFIAVYNEALFFVFFILFIRSAVAKFFTPVETSLVQGVLNKEQYMQAAGLNQTVVGMFMLFGVGLGALAYKFIGIEGAVIADGISFIISAFLIRSCTIPNEVRLPNGKAEWRDIQLRTVLADFRQGIAYIVQYKLLLSIIFGFFIFGIINGGFAVLPIFTMKYKLAPDSYETYSSLFSVFLGTGFIIGSIIGNPIMKSMKPYQMIIGGIFATGLLTLSFGFTQNVWIYLSLIFVTGLILAPVNIALNGWMTELVDPKIMGRVSAWIDPLMMSAHSLALGAVAIVFPRWVNVDTMYYVLALLMFVVSFYYLLVLPRLVRQREAVLVKEEISM